MYEEYICNAARTMAETMKNADIPMYGSRLRLPDRKAIITLLKEMRQLMFPAYFGDPALMTLAAADYAALLLDREEIDNRFILHDAIKVIPVYIIVVYVIALGCSYILP